MVEERKQNYRKGSSSRARVPVQKDGFQWWRKGCSGKRSVTMVEEGYQCWRKGSSSTETVKKYMKGSSGKVRVPVQ